MLVLTPKPLNKEAFVPYGEVVDTQSARKTFPMNYGLATRYCDLAEIDIAEKSGITCISLVETKAITFPFEPKVMEYHPYGSQLFYPVCGSPFLILVAPQGKQLDASKVELFISDGTQGVNYHKNVWHHYLMPLEDNSAFFVVDRKADDENCVEVEIGLDITIKLK
ncbi:MAG: ureidoglycolate lyase [Cocleimonas sp.]